MKDLYEIFRPTLVLLGCAITAFVFFAIVSFIYRQGGPNSAQNVNYVDVVTILLTTVTVVFTVAALALTLVGVWGFKTLVDDAKKYAAKTADEEVQRTIQSAFDSDGIFSQGMANELRTGSGPFAEWLRAAVEREVTYQMALSNRGEPVDEDDPSDEGDQD